MEGSTHPNAISAFHHYIYEITYHVKNHWFARPSGSKLRVVRSRLQGIMGIAGNLGIPCVFAVHDTGAKKFSLAKKHN